MFVDRKKHEVYEAYFHRCPLTDAKAKCRAEEMEERLVPFPAYYQERLEYWKGRFDKKPEPYQVILRIVSSDYVQFEEFDTFDDALARCNDVRANIDNHTTFMFADKNWNPSNVVCCHVVSGHPAPYTPAEIEAWAKEKVEAEMKDWRVAKEEPKQDPFGLRAFLGINQQVNRNPWWSSSSK